MTKNAGGARGKKMARKGINTGKQNAPIRIAKYTGEIYGQATKCLGNCMVSVYCIDRVERLCKIRGKFAGRGKRGNMVSVGTWILIGVHEWTNTSAVEKRKKMEECDLLEVYQDSDKNKLQDADINAEWDVFTDYNNRLVTSFGAIATAETAGFKFSDKNDDEYDKLVTSAACSKINTNMIATSDGVEIDFDDI